MSDSNYNSYQHNNRSIYDHELGLDNNRIDNNNDNNNENDVIMIESKTQYSSLCHYITFIMLISSIVSIGLMSKSGFGFSDLNSNTNNDGSIMHITKLDDLPRDILFANFSEPEQMKAFSLFIDKFGKTYSKDEYGEKFKAFKMSLDKIDKRNMGRGSSNIKNSARHGITKFSDMTSEEFASKYLTAKKR